MEEIAAIGKRSLSTSTLIAETAELPPHHTLTLLSHAPPTPSLLQLIATGSVSPHVASRMVSSLTPQDARSLASNPSSHPGAFLAAVLDTPHTPILRPMLLTSLSALNEDDGKRVLAAGVKVVAPFHDLLHRLGRFLASDSHALGLLLALAKHVPIESNNGREDGVLSKLAYLACVERIPGFGAKAVEVLVSLPRSSLGLSSHASGSYLESILSPFGLCDKSCVALQVVRAVVASDAVLELIPVLTSPGYAETVFPLLSGLDSLGGHVRDALTHVTSTALRDAAPIAMGSAWDSDGLALGLGLQRIVLGRDSLTAYREWFCDHLLASLSSKSDLNTLLTALISLVPHEAPEYLEAHMSALKCSSLADPGMVAEYVTLAKTRIPAPSDEGPSTGGRGGEGGVEGSAELDARLAQVLAHFKAHSNALLPALVHDMLWRRSWFLVWFVPRLLRPLDPVDPVQREVISALIDAGKIEASSLEHYDAACLDSTYSLTEGSLTSRLASLYKAYADNSGSSLSAQHIRGSLQDLLASLAAPGEYLAAVQAFLDGIIELATASGSDLFSAPSLAARRDLYVIALPPGNKSMLDAFLARIRELFIDQATSLDARVIPVLSLLLSELSEDLLPWDGCKCVVMGTLFDGMWGSGIRVQALFAHGFVHAVLAREDDPAPSRGQRGCECVHEIPVPMVTFLEWMHVRAPPQLDPSVLGSVRALVSSPLFRALSRVLGQHRLEGILAGEAGVAEPDPEGLAGAVWTLLPQTANTLGSCIRALSPGVCSPPVRSALSLALGSLVAPFNPYDVVEAALDPSALATGHFSVPHVLAGLASLFPTLPDMTEYTGSTGGRDGGYGYVSDAIVASGCLLSPRPLPQGAGNAVVSLFLSSSSGHGTQWALYGLLMACRPAIPPIAHESVCRALELVGEARSYGRLPLSSVASLPRVALPSSADDVVCGLVGFGLSSEIARSVPRVGEVLGELVREWGWLEDERVVGAAVEVAIGFAAAQGVGPVGTSLEWAKQLVRVHPGLVLRVMDGGGVAGGGGRWYERRRTSPGRSIVFLKELVKEIPSTVVEKELEVFTRVVLGAYADVLVHHGGVDGGEDGGEDGGDDGQIVRDVRERVRSLARGWGWTRSLLEGGSWGPVIARWDPEVLYSDQ